MPSNLDFLLDAIRSSMRSEALDEETPCNALITCVYIYNYQSSIKASADYIPTAEMDMIFASLKSLPAESEITPLLISLLVELMDDCHQKKSPHYEHYFKKIENIFQSQDSRAFSRLPSVASSPVLSRLAETRFLKEKLTAPPLSLEKINASIDVRMSEATKMSSKEDDNQVAVDKSKELKSVIANLNSAKDLEQNLEVLLISCAQKDITPQILVTIIQKVVATYDNELKKLFISTFFTTYQNLYSQVPNGYLEKTVLLQGITIILPILGQLLSYPQFLDLLKTFELPEPGPFEYSAHADYTLIRALAENKPIPLGSSIKSTLSAMMQRQPLTILNSLAVAAPYNEPQSLDSNMEAKESPFMVRNYMESKGLKQAFASLVSHLNQINSRAGEYQQRNIGLLMIRYQPQLMQLTELMGETAILGLHQLVANTALPLESTLKKIPLLEDFLLRPLQDYCVKHVKTPGAFNTFKFCLPLIGVLAQGNMSESPFEDSSEESCQLLLNMIASNLPPQGLLFQLVSALLQQILPAHTIQLEEAGINALLKHIPIERLASLLIASHKMKDDSFADIYAEFLKIDLFGGDFDRLLHDQRQENPVGQDLARHNNHIKEVLTSKGINPQNALCYQKKYDFILLPQNMTKEQFHLYNLHYILWQDLMQLDDELSKIKQDELSPIYQNTLKKVKSNLDQVRNKIKHKIELGINERKAAYAVLSDSDVFGTIVSKNIVQAAKSLSQTDNLPQLKSVDNALKHLAQIQQQSTNQLLFESKSSVHYFTVEQLPKGDAIVHFLGDEVGCCLATDGDSFSALTPRRLDDAILFHVVKDKTTDKPVALIWLYLAETEDKRIVLIANFFEIKAKFGLNDYKRQALLNALLAFTSQYLADNPRIDGFYMNELRYGLNRHDLKCYPQKSLALLDKVGGPYIQGGAVDSLSQENLRQLTAAQYRLASLDSNQFREFSLPTLCANQQENIITLPEYIHQIVLSSMADGVTFDALLDQIIECYGADLEYFFSPPLATNSQLRDIVYPEFQKATLSSTAVADDDSSKSDLKHKYLFFTPRDRTVEPKPNIEIEHNNPEV